MTDKQYFDKDYCRVSKKWLESLAQYAEDARKELDKLEDGTARLITAPLIGYASSAKTLIKYQI